MRDYRVMLSRSVLLAGVGVFTAIEASNAIETSAVAAPTRAELLPSAIVALSAALGAWTILRGFAYLRRVD